MNAKAKLTAAGLVLLALLVVPAPLLPPLGLATKVQSALGVNWKTAYLIAAIGLHVTLYGSLGVLAAFAVGPGKQRRQRLLQLVIVPVIVVGVAVLVRSVKLGHVPMLHNAVIPMAACAVGVVAGLLFRAHGWRVTLGAMLVLLAGLAWAHWPGVSSELSRATETRLQRLVDSLPGLPAGEERFGALLQAAFAPLPSDSAQPTAVGHNRAAILALGIAIGHERLARYAGLKQENELVRAGTVLRADTTLRGREDWSRHYCLSAALAVVENSFLSDAGGLMKEQLDALTQGTGFSFGDLAADRAGVSFAQAATASESAALAMQKRLQSGYSADDFFPPASDLPENLTTEQFRAEYGGVGSQRYRRTVREIETRLNRCAGLSSQPDQKLPTLFVILIAWVLVAITVAVHAVGLAVLFKYLMRSHAQLPTRFWPTTGVLIRVTWCLIMFHLVEIAVWGCFYFWQECMPDAESAFYFAGVTYTTVGYGDLVLPKPWRMLGPVEALTGILMCGLSTGFFFAVVNKIFGAKFRAEPG